MASDCKSFLLCVEQTKEKKSKVKPPISGQPLDKKIIFPLSVDVQLWKVNHVVFVHGGDCDELSADMGCLPIEAVCQ